MRLAAALLLLAGLAAAPTRAAELRVEIHEPDPRVPVATSQQSSVEVVGSASIYGGVKALDLFLVVDSSESLRRTDRDDHRTRGIVNLVRSLHPKANIHIGVVDFDRKATLLSPLTPDRAAVIRALELLDQKGETNIAAGIRTALRGFAERGRIGASRVILLFTDGKSDEAKALAAMDEARVAGVAVHTLLLGGEEKGEALLRDIADGTQASFVRVTDPTRLPEAFLNLRTTGVERVMLRVNGGPPVPTRLVGGNFTGRVSLRPGSNRIEAAATSLGGTTAVTAVEVTVGGPLRVRIDTPGDGSELASGDAVWVRGSASTWDAATEQAAPPGADRGVREVLLRVNDGPPVRTELIAGDFEARVPLRDGLNRLVARATSLDGRTAEHAVMVSVRAPGCAELEIQAQRGDRPAASISDRAVEIVFDASNSMWGRMHGQPKISVAKDILTDALHWLPEDLALSLRVYGHQQPHERRHCRDSELLVPLGPGSRDRIRDVIGSFKPRGQTPLAYSLQQIAADFAGFRGERAVVLVTDGIESCDGDPVAAARALQRTGKVPVHVIGFGLANDADEDTAALRNIALASGGRFFTAGSAQELRDALAGSVGTPFTVRRGDRAVARGTLGGDDPIRLPEGEYTLHLESAPPYEVPLRLESEQGTTLLLKRQGRKVYQARRNEPIGHVRCELPEASAPAAADGGMVWEELPDAGRR